MVPSIILLRKAWHTISEASIKFFSFTYRILKKLLTLVPSSSVLGEMYWIILGKFCHTTSCNAAHKAYLIRNLESNCG